MLPRGHDVAGQLERVDARVVGLQVGPEQLAEQVGEALQRREVHRRLTLAQVVDQQVAHRPAPDAVAVDQLPAARPATAGEHLERGGRVGAEPAVGAQQLVEQRAVRVRVAAAVCAGDVEKFNAVPDVDVGHHAAFGGHDHRDPGQRLLPGLQPDRPDRAQPRQLVEGGAVAGSAHLLGQAAASRRVAEQPRQTRPHDVGADEDQQPGRQPR